ncbi:MAG: Transcriptional regulator [candidate division WS6 bacterium GW2011_GWF2_39_15]|uniref:Transcriptional regulator n=1 Tax=candidate division WS6 bacterium GW2011_GWF2_39_15 TaxID=1619100 RepID=A0A0G0MN53_9BACT|nr:MAG: Transcriptional regulator [candidate division WS6 bacterium GW2011_GWF2_39_15]
MKKVKRSSVVEPEFYGTATVGTKGQIVIPNEVRKRYDIKTGDKLVIFSGEGGVIAIMKSDKLNDLLKGISAIAK